MRIKLASSLFTLGVLAYALPALASAGNVSSIGMMDYDHDGKIDRAVVTFSNPSASAWQVHGTKGIGVSYHGAPLALRAVFMASTGNPAQLEIVLDERDANLPATTAADGFEVTYAPQGAASGVSDGTTELSAIATGDTGPGDTELDQAAPVLLSSSPSDGTIDATRDTDLRLTFSEPVIASSAVPTSSQNPDGWSFSSADDVLTVTHGAYGRGVTESFGVDVVDAAGNHAAPGAYPNPFSFRTGTANSPTPSADNVFEMTAPASLDTLTAGSPNVLGWYGNDPSVAYVRLSFSSDGGSTYVRLATRPVSEGTYVWYPPAIGSVIQMKAEALSANGAVMNVAFVSAVSVAGAATAPIRIISGPDVSMVTDTTAKASVSVDRIPTTATASCGGNPATVTVTGDRPASLEALAEGLTASPITCRFIVSEPGSDALVVDSPAMTAAVQAAPAPQGAGFIALKENDLIKSSASSAVYWYKSGKRFGFPNETAYASWFGADFSKVLTVPTAQLASIMLGGNVKMKAGVYLIKIQSDPKTYAVEPDGTLRWIQTEAQASALYGAAWNKRVRDVDVSLFTDYSIGAPLQGEEKPAGYAN